MFPTSLFRLGVLVAALTVGVPVLAAPAGPALPKDVTGFLQDREGCDHFRGESGDGDEERQKDIDWNLCQSCTGTDAKLAALKKKYRANATVMRALQSLEPNIEITDVEEMKRFCATTRKPAWAK